MLVVFNRPVEVYEPEAHHAMLRLVVENVLLFLLPTVFYIAYALLRRHLDDGSQQANQPSGSTSQDASTSNGDTDKAPATKGADLLRDAPFIWLALIGAGLVFAVLALFGSVSTSNPNGTYEPAIYKDGKIVPGRIK
jgi:hypothetical protein